MVSLNQHLFPRPGKEPPKCGDPSSILSSGLGKTPWRRDRIHSYSFAGESPKGQSGAWRGYRLWGCVQTQLSDELGEPRTQIHQEFIHRMTYIKRTYIQVLFREAFLAPHKR